MNLLHVFHSVNIMVHVTAGTLALIVGIIALISKKGKKVHTKSGKLFVTLLTIVIVTGLLGVLVFGRHSFLLVITLLSAYQGFSGYRVLKAKNNQVKGLDVLMASITLLSALFFIFYRKQIGMFWTPVITYSTLGALFTVIIYDFLRYLIPASLYGHLWLYEHIYKMIGAFTALLAAFAGTVFSSYQPYSQILPSIFGIVLQIGFLTFYIKKRKPTQKMQFA